MKSIASLQALVVVLAVGVATIASPAHASNRLLSNSGSQCDAADGALTSGLKKRKTGLKNESTAVRYITCAIPYSGSTSGLSQFDFASVEIAGTAGTSVTCAFHVGDTEHSYASKTQSITLVGTSTNYMYFDSSTAPPARGSSYSVALLTCTLPSQTELQFIYVGVQDPA